MTIDMNGPAATPIAAPGNDLLVYVRPKVFTQLFGATCLFLVGFFTWMCIEDIGEPVERPRLPPLIGLGQGVHINHPNRVQNGLGQALLWGVQRPRVVTGQPGDMLGHRGQLDDTAGIGFVGQQQVKHRGHLEVRQIPRPIRHHALGDVKPCFEQRAWRGRPPCQ